MVTIKAAEAQDTCLRCHERLARPEAARRRRILCEDCQDEDDQPG